VRDVDLAIEAGQTHGLVGESGSGKTTLARILLRLIAPDAGSVTFRGRNLLSLRGAELRETRRHIQLVHQDPFSSVDPRFTVRDIVAEPWVCMAKLSNRAPIANRLTWYRKTYRTGGVGRPFLAADLKQVGAIGLTSRQTRVERRCSALGGCFRATLVEVVSLKGAYGQSL
jgi:ABC-type glutathione transport system ATPase component